MVPVIRILKKTMDFVQKPSTQNVQICTSVVIKKKERLILEGRFDHFFGHGNVPVVIECIAIKTDCSKNKKRKIPTNPYPAMRIETAKYHEIETIFQNHHSICSHVLGRRGNFMKILSFLGYKCRIHKN